MFPPVDPTLSSLRPFLSLSDGEWGKRWNCADATALQVRFVWFFLLSLLYEITSILHFRRGSRPSVPSWATWATRYDNNVALAQSFLYWRRNRKKNIFSLRFIRCCGLKIISKTFIPNDETAIVVDPGCFGARRLFNIWCLMQQTNENHHNDNSYLYIFSQQQQQQQQNCSNTFSQNASSFSRRRHRPHQQDPVSQFCVVFLTTENNTHKKTERKTNKRNYECRFVCSS